MTEFVSIDDVVIQPENPGSRIEFAARYGLDPNSLTARIEYDKATEAYRDELALAGNMSRERLHNLSPLRRAVEVLPVDASEAA